MPKTELQTELERLLERTNEGTSFSSLPDEILSLAAKHPDALAGLTHRYRLTVTDLSLSRAFALENGVVHLLTDSDEVDVTLSATEKTLRDVLCRKLSPMVAVMRGKIKVRGDMKALLHLADKL